ncbi:MAG: right-handed parallel beta-helix repeat-containing protein [Sedimentisphaerales bacterium]
MSQKTHLLAAGCIVSLVLGIYAGWTQAKSFTLSEEQLLLLDCDGKEFLGDHDVAKIIAQRDVPGLGVEFDLYFPPGCNFKTDTVEYVSSITGGEGKLVGFKNKDYDNFTLKFTLLKVNDSNIPINWGPLKVGTVINSGNSFVSGESTSFGTVKYASLNTISKTAMKNADIINIIGFAANLQMAKNIDANSPQGLKITLLIEPAPDAEILSFSPPSAPQYVSSDAKVLLVPDQYPKIQDAIDAAQKGNVVNIRAGDYEESLTLKSGVSIKGLDVNGVVIHCDVIDGPVMKAEDCNLLIISDLTLKHTGMERMSADFEGRFPVLLIKSGQITVTRCKIQNSGKNGISITDWDSTISECDISDSKFNGIVINGFAHVAIRNNNCCRNGGNGICFAANASGDLTGNTCNENVYNGISLNNDQTNVNLSQNTCANNKGSGIYFSPGAKGIAIGNICRANTNNGITVTGNGTNPILEKNEANDNNGCGIYFGDRTGGEALNNICSGNQWHGISIADSWAKSRIYANHCFNNKRCGLYLGYGFRAEIGDNDIQDNGEISFRDVDGLLVRNKFPELESLASRLRTEKSRFHNGNWQLSYFYEALVSGWANPHNFPKFKDKIDKWITGEPNSITPRVALAKTYRELAWEARGSGYANEVSEKGWEGFKENLINAEKVLTEAEDLNASDPVLYSIWLTVGMGLGKTDDDMNALFEKGIAIEKYYWPLYINRAYAITPRWGGKPGQLEAFARHAVELTKEKEGQILYLIIAGVTVGMNNSEPQDFKQLGFSYKTLQQAQGDLIKHYPDANNNYLLNFSCFLACAYDDKEEAKNLLVQIGSNWDKSVWVSEDIFNKYKNWVLTKTDKPAEPNE